MFQLTKSEKLEVITSCDHLARLKYSPGLPFAFAEHGVHNQAIAGLIDAIRQLMTQPAGNSRPIGFTAKIGPAE